MKIPEKVQGILLVLGAGMCWGTSGTLHALAPEEATSLSIGAARIIFAAIGIIAAVLIIRGREFFRGQWKLKGVLIASAGLAAYQITFFAGVKLTGVGIGTMIAIGASPPLAGLWGHLFFGERLKTRWYISTVTAIAGCALLILGGNAGELKISMSGVLLSFLAALSYSFEGVGVRMSGRGALDLNAAIFFTTAILMLPVLILSDCSWMFSAHGVLTVILLAFVSMLLPYILFTIGITKISLGAAYTFGLSEPLTAWFLSTVLLGEKMSFTACCGVALLFAGILVLAGQTSKNSEDNNG